MITEVITRYFHFIGIFCLFSSLVVEHLLIQTEMKRSEVKRLAVVDSIYGISALVVLITGLLLWFVVGKSSEFYLGNAVFHVKITIFIIVALISVYPTLTLAKARRGESDDSVSISKAVIMVIRFELLLLILMPLLASLMAKGIGSF